jgi:hypothetical protein
MTITATKIRFTHKGEEFQLTKDDFVKALKGVQPGRIQKYSVEVNGIDYPIRQVVALTMRRPTIEFTSHDAYRILQKYGFTIQTEG